MKLKKCSIYFMFYPYLWLLPPMVGWGILGYDPNDIQTYLNYAYYLIFLISCIFFILYLIYSIKTDNPRELLKFSMIIKIVHIPIYIYYLVCGLLCLVTVVGVFITMIIMMFSVLLIFLSGLFASIAIVRSKVVVGKLSILFILSQFIYVIDIFVAVILYLKSKTMKSDCDVLCD